MVLRQGRAAEQQLIKAANDLPRFKPRLVDPSWQQLLLPLKWHRTKQSLCSEKRRSS